MEEGDDREFVLEALKGRMNVEAGLERHRSSRVRRLRLAGGGIEDEEVLKSLLALNPERSALR